MFCKWGMEGIYQGMEHLTVQCCGQQHVRKILTSAETWYTRIERDMLGILCGVEKFQHYCFTHEISMITDRKLLVAIFKKDVASQSHRLQRILLQIHQHNIRILYQPGPQQFITDWPSSHNYKGKWNEE